MLFIILFQIFFLAFHNDVACVYYISWQIVYICYYKLKSKIKMIKKRIISIILILFFILPICFSFSNVLWFSKTWNLISDQIWIKKNNKYSKWKQIIWINSFSWKSKKYFSSSKLAIIWWNYIKKWSNIILKWNI